MVDFANLTKLASLKCVFFRIHSWTLGSNGNRTAHWHPRNQQSGSCCSPICSPCKSFRSNFHGLDFYELTFFPRQTDVNVARTNPKQGIHHQIDYMQTAKRSSISERPHEIEPKTNFQDPWQKRGICTIVPTQSSSSNESC